MIVSDFNIIGIIAIPNEANAPLVIYLYAVLPFTITIKLF